MQEQYFYLAAFMLSPLFLGLLLYNAWYLRKNPEEAKSVPILVLTIIGIVSSNPLAALLVVLEDWPALIILLATVAGLIDCAIARWKAVRRC